MNVVFCGLVFIGNIFVYLGIILESVVILFIGRVIYGIGGESLNIGIGNLLIIWFNGKELAFSQVSKGI